MQTGSLKITYLEIITMIKKDFFMTDPVRCYNCARCIPHSKQQHEEHLAIWCDAHRRWCKDHKIERQDKYLVTQAYAS
jgi:hypothetical protein